MTEALRALAVLLEPPQAEHAAIAAALELPGAPTADEHTAIIAFQAYPYASAYLGAEGMLGGEARDRIAGFWRALGGEPPAEPDHLSVLLAALADAQAPQWSPAGGTLPSGAASSVPGELATQVIVRLPVAGASSGGAASSVRGALFWEHVASWMPPYLALLRRVGGGFHVAWAELLAEILAELAGELGPPVRLPLALRAAPPLAAPADLGELLATLLAPARTGLVLVRDDLARMAADLGLGLRAGERRFALRSLLAEDPAAVLRWLAGEARAQSSALVALPPITAWWAARAGATAAWLDELAGVALRSRGGGEQPAAPDAPLARGLGLDAK